MSERSQDRPHHRGRWRRARRRCPRGVEVVVLDLMLKVATTTGSALNLARVHRAATATWTTKKRTQCQS